MNELDNDLARPEVKQCFSVSEISGQIKNLLENNLSWVRIKGEISGLKIASSGHCYFNLKDDNAIIAATCWRHTMSRIKFKMIDGLEVVVSGKVTAYAGQSKYQISASNIEPEGVGAFMQILTERKNRLAKLGIFDQQHKKKIPFLPKQIGVITSITGAVIRDILHRITDRCPTYVTIWPVAVQGENSATEVISAVKGFNQLKADDAPDVIIIARGGGSIEDLWSFNDEELAKEVFKSNIPVISAIGHETDYTILDLVADVRAPTPTAAAEFAVPVKADLQATITTMVGILQSKLQQKIDMHSKSLQYFDRILQNFDSMMAYYIQRLDELSLRLQSALPSLLRQKQEALDVRFIGKEKLYRYLAINSEKLSNIWQKMEYLSRACLHQTQMRLENNSQLLASLDYRSVLKRGYVMVQNQEGSYLTSAKDAPEGAEITLTFSDGKIRANTK